MGLKLITPPPVEPLTRTDAYVQCQIDTVTTGSPPVTTSEHDAWIDAIIPVLRNEVEGNTDRALVTQTWELWLDHFPGQRAMPGGTYFADIYPWTFSGSRGHLAVRIPMPPLQSITSVTYIDENGDTQTFSPSDYVLDDSVEPAKIVPKPGMCWPRVQIQPGAVKIRFVCGYPPVMAGSPPAVTSYTENIPKDIIHWMKLHMSHWFRNREASWQVTSTVTNAEIPFAADLLARYKVFGYGQQ